MSATGCIRSVPASEYTFCERPIPVVRQSFGDCFALRARNDEARLAMTQLNAQ